MASARWLQVAMCCGMLLPSIGRGAAGAPTAEELLAAQDKSAQTQLSKWIEGAFDLPNDVVLDVPLRAAATQIVKEHIDRMRSMWPTWIAQERSASGDPYLRGRALVQPLYLRLTNEMAIGSVESAGPAYDVAWTKLALTPTACKTLPSAFFAKRLAMIQAAPLDVRPVLLAGERELLGRWGTKRVDLPARPPVQDMEGAYQAIERLRADLPISAEPMTAFLADREFARDRKGDSPDRWEQCGKSQWWLASQLARHDVAPATALNIYRYSMMFDVRDSVPASITENVGSGNTLGGQPSYPAIATYFHVEGATVTEVHTDGKGNFSKAWVVSRKIVVPGVRDNPPLAFETLLDAAAVGYAATRSYSATGASTVKIPMQWKLQGGGNETH